MNAIQKCKTVKRLLIVCLFIQATVGNIFSQTTETSVADSVLLAYYNRCKQVLQQPEVLQMADTLYNMATGYSNPKMQVVALCTKLDYYYYSKDEHKADSILAWVKRIRKFSRQTNQPRYYYFVWSARLIRSKIALGEYNIALVETEKMLREAEAENFLEGIADCYNCMTAIYTAKEMTEKRQEFTLKEIEIMEKNNLERYNISQQYSNAARYFSEHGEFERAEELLTKAMSTARTPHQEFYARLSNVVYYMNLGDMQAAGRELEAIRQMPAEQPSLNTHLHFLYAIEEGYYYRLKRYDEALRYSGLREEALKKRNETVSIDALLNSRAEIYWDMGRKEEATAIYRQLLVDIARQQVKQEETTTAEFATLLNVQQLNAEKNELSRLSQKRKIQNTQIIIISLAALLLIVFFFLYRQNILYRKLKRSRDRLNDQNQMLLKTREELRLARDMAEQSSRMKTVFIQSMSHEIRTPLNSIVGFSAVLADMFSETDDEVLQYAKLIEDNSQLLLKMISDILDISTLDQMDENIPLSPVDFNRCCINSLNEVRPLVAADVELNFLPAREKLVINGNDGYLRQVLDNLLQNAAKFTAKGSITLAYTLDDNNRQLVVSVTDTGIGIPPDKQESVFQRFVKLDEFSQGTGLGLAICQLIAEKMGGTLIIEKKYSSGSRFIFSMPI